MTPGPSRPRTASAGPLAWDEPVDRVQGLGPAAREALADAGVTSIADLVWLLPVAWDDLRAPITIAEAVQRATAAGPLAEPERVCMRGVVTSAGLVPMRGRRSVRIVLADEPGGKPTLHAWWFFAAHGVLAAAKVGTACLLMGRVKVEPSKPARVAHGDLVVDGPGARVVRPRYPRLGVPDATLRAAIASALGRLDALPDPVPAAIARREAMPPVEARLRAVHVTAGSPPSDDDRRALGERLAWAEGFARVRDRLRARAGEGAAPALRRDPSLRARFEAELGFALTKGQTAAIDAIALDLAKTIPMRRLLLGDVGTGKTAVALAAAAQCVAAGWQVAILAPTSLLAEQYMDAAAPLARATGAAIAPVTGGMPAAQRQRAAAQLAQGKTQVAIGTHALLSQGTVFARLGLVIVDEQHRLGVGQRIALVQKGHKGAAGSATPHLLTLSATPIPRTLALALRGELATSTLDERPRGRRPVATALWPRSRYDRVVAEIRKTCARGERVFVVAPRIEDADGESGASASGAIARAKALATDLAPVHVALVHGALSMPAKRAAMHAFRAGDAQVLVGTTVVEVGIDVPEATLMVIEGAERFGLAQLHQLRGRVGRGDRPGRCVLVHADDLPDVARRRLDAITRLHDGAAVARADLELRGAGDLGGTRQSGVEDDLFFLDPASPPAWLERLEADARALLADDPDLSRPDHRALALAVNRFARVLAVREEAG